MTNSKRLAYTAEIRFDEYDVAHIKAPSLADATFGQGYACGSHHFATIADQVTKVRSQRSQFLGPGVDDSNLNTDFGYLALGLQDRAEATMRAQSDETLNAVEAYACGLNQWLEENGRESLPGWCRNAEWIRPLSTLDMFCLYTDLALIASGRNLAGYIGAAVNPGDTLGGSIGPGGLLGGDPALGSNAWAFGRKESATGRGALVANPHFPWYGEARFWECHLYVPGEINVSGASLIGTPGIQIGFNESIAWSHTFSRGHRFTIYRLALSDADPTKYLVDGVEKDMDSQDFSIDVLEADGSQKTVSRTLYSTHHGPMVALPPFGWSSEFGFSYRDANLDNQGLIEQWLRINRCDSVSQIHTALRDIDGIPWVNTMAADKHGDCLYIDSSATPHLTPEAQKDFTEAISNDPFVAFAHAQRVALLDGSKSANDWVESSNSKRRGIATPEAHPFVIRDDHVFNSNDPYWLPSVHCQLEEFSPMQGLHRRPISARTRMNLRILSGESGHRPPEGRWTPKSLQEALFDNESITAVLIKDELVSRLRAATRDPDAQDPGALEGMAEVLRGWNNRFDLDAVGAVLFREFLGEFTPEDLSNAGPIFTDTFDPDDPLHTPSRAANGTNDGRDPWVLAALRAKSLLESQNIAISTPLGQVQYAMRGDLRIPTHGGFELDGIVNVLGSWGPLTRSDLEPTPNVGNPVTSRATSTGLHDTGYPCQYGTSFVMIVQFDDRGPQANGLLCYGQSGDPESVHHSDQTVLFSQKHLRAMPFVWEEVERSCTARVLGVSNG